MPLHLYSQHTAPLIAHFSESYRGSYSMHKENKLLIIISEQMISTYFQPIISADGQSIYAYEALSGGPVR